MKIKFKKSEIKDISKKILDKILQQDNTKAIVVAFSGDLGSGKTTMTQEIAKHLKIKEKIISPTFVIMKSYNINSVSEYYPYFKKLIHIDAYRLEAHEELLKIGWSELEDDKNNLIIIEWPERVSKSLSVKPLNVVFKHVDEENRFIEL